MIAAAALGLAFAAASVAAGRWLEGFIAGAESDWAWAQAGLAFARFAVIFAAAGVLWWARGDARLVAVFVVTGAVAQMVGQIVFWMKDERSRKDDKGNWDG